MRFRTIEARSASEDRTYYPVLSTQYSVLSTQHVVVPLLSVCFLVIAFLLLLVRTMPTEGGLTLRTPLALPKQPSPDFSQLPTIKIRLQANADGTLASIAMNQRPVKNCDDLRSEIRAIVRPNRRGEFNSPLPSAPDVELNCDYNLSYEYTMQALTALSGYLDDDGRLVKLVERVKFSPRRKAKP